MGEDRVQRSVRFLQAASKARAEGLDCPEALLAAYREELGGQYQAVRELAKRLPEEMGEPDLCDIFAAAYAIMCTLTGREDSNKEAAARIQKEYGTNGCGSGRQETPLCTCRMKDCVLLIEWARSRAGM